MQAKEARKRHEQGENMARFMSEGHEEDGRDGGIPRREGGNGGITGSGNGIGDREIEQATRKMGEGWNSKLTGGTGDRKGRDIRRDVQRASMETNTQE